jgi:hypothetical protein
VGFGAELEVEHLEPARLRDTLCDGANPVEPARFGFLPDHVPSPET